jgi:hypothetical protein
MLLVVNIFFKKAQLNAVLEHNRRFADRAEALAAGRRAA